MRRFFALLVVFVLLLSVAYAAEAPSEESPSISDMMEGVMDLVSQVVPEHDGEVLDYDPEPSTDSDGSPNLGGGSNLVVVNTPSYSASDIGAAVYRALIEAEQQRIDEYSTISDLEIMPLYTPDQGNTTIPTGSLRYVLTQVIGPYSPVVVQYQYTSGSNTAYLREIMPDYVWMFSAAIFALVLYCVFRLWGAILCRR